MPSNDQSAPIITTAPLSNSELPDVWAPVTQWPHKWPTQGSWRALIFNAGSRETSRGTIPGNGLIEAGVVRRVGSRVLVNPRRFFQWVEKQGGV